MSYRICDRCDEQASHLAIFDAIFRERVRQESLKAAGRFKYTCADPEMIPTEKLTVLAEEFGEVAKGVLNVIGHSTDFVDPQQEKLRKELVQVAAVAVAWIEDIDRRRG